MRPVGGQRCDDVETGFKARRAGVFRSKSCGWDAGKRSGDVEKFRRKTVSKGWARRRVVVVKGGW